MKPPGGRSEPSRPPSTCTAEQSDESEEEMSIEDY